MTLLSAWQVLPSHQAYLNMSDLAHLQDSLVNNQQQGLAGRNTAIGLVTQCTA